jgi:hypothetical protein
MTNLTTATATSWNMLGLQLTASIR